jgi:hypothetical protein
VTAHRKDRRIVVTINDWTGTYAVDAEVAETISRDLLVGGHADAVTIDDESTAGLRRYPCERLWTVRLSGPPEGVPDAVDWHG